MMQERIIWILDDDVRGEGTVAARRLSKVFPDAKIGLFRSGEKACAFLKTEPVTRWPSIVFFDAYDRDTDDRTKGFQEYMAVKREMLKLAGPEHIPKHIVFFSADYEMALESKESALAQGFSTDSTIYAMNKRSDYALLSEIGDPACVCSGEPERIFGHAAQDTIDVLALLNKINGTSYPIARKEVIEYFGERNRLSAALIADLFKEGKISPETTLRWLAYAPEDDKKEGFASSFIDVFLPFNWVGARMLFRKAAGQTCHGHVAFSEQDVADLCDEKKKAILVLNRLSPEAYDLLPKISGIAVREAAASDHLVFMAQSKGVSVLIQDCERHLLADKAMFSSGDAVTLVTTSAPGLYFSHLSLRQVKRPVFSTRINGVFAQEAKKNNWPVPTFKINVDDLSCLREIRDFEGGVGLARTERFVFADAHARNALSEIVRARGGDQKQNEAFARTQSVHFARLFSNIEQAMPHQAAGAYPVRVRLLDAPLGEFMGEGAYAHVPKNARRGVQFGLTFPSIYDGQIDALFEAYKERKEKQIRLEVMVPSVRVLDELLTVKNKIHESARLKNVALNEIGFGMMAETVRACEDMAAFAPHVDFINFGTGDLTHDFLGVSRSDFMAQEAYEKENGYNPQNVLSPRIADIIVRTTKTLRAHNPSAKACFCGAHVINRETALPLVEAGIDEYSLSPFDPKLERTRRDIFLALSRSFFEKQANLR